MNVWESGACPPFLSGLPVSCSFCSLAILILTRWSCLRWAAAGLTVRDIGTKLVSRKVSTLLVSLYGSMIFAISGAILLSITGGAAWPDVTMIVMFLAMIGLGSVGYVCVTKAVRIGEMSVVSPFRYSRLLFSVMAGVLVLGERVDAMMLLGCALTIGAGLYIWRREIILMPEKGTVTPPKHENPVDDA